MIVFIIVFTNTVHSLGQPQNILVDLLTYKKLILFGYSYCIVTDLLHIYVMNE
jgi:hypothetical protein